MKFYQTNTQNALTRLQEEGYKILIIFHPSTPDNKRYFITSSFTPAQNQIFDHTLTGKEITNLITEDWLSMLVGSSISQPIDHLQKQTLETKLNELKDRTIKFSEDYSYEWWM